MFGPPALQSRNRHIAFGRTLAPQVLNKHFVNVSRVVLDPTYRGCGLAHRMLRTACELYADRKGVRYFEALSSMAHLNRLNAAAGFKTVGTSNMLKAQTAKGSWWSNKGYQVKGKHRVLVYEILDIQSARTGPSR